MRENRLINLEKAAKTKRFTCSGCGKEKLRTDFHEAHYNDRKREVTSRCRECRREDYHARRYPTVCIQCLKHRALDTNSICRGCNEDNGMRQCLRCCELLLSFVEFRGSRRTCTKCLVRQQPTASASSPA